VRLLILIGLAVAFFASASAFGQAQYWVNPAGGDWGVPTNWNPAGAPSSPVFNLGSSGYTTSISTSYYTYGGVAVETDNVTLDLNGNTLTTPTLSVATASSQNGSLTLVGPGTVDILNEILGTPPGPVPGNVYVGTGGGIGQLTVNGAILENGGGEHTGQFMANGLLVENGGQLNLPNSGSVSISSAVFNDGSLTPWQDAEVSLSGITMTNGSSASGFLVNINGAYLDDSTISSGGSGGTISGTVTLLDNATLHMVDQVVAGTIDIMPTAGDLSAGINMDNSGVLSVQLYNGIDNPFAVPVSKNEGTLDFTLENGFTPSIGEQFQVMLIDPYPYPYPAGTFATVNLPTLSGATWDTSQLYNTGIISVVVPEPVSIGMAAMGAAVLSLRRRRKNNLAR
jgi:hypothetical protein